MDRLFLPLVLIALMAVPGLAQDDVQVRIETEAGKVDVELYPSKAPSRIS